MREILYATSTNDFFKISQTEAFNKFLIYNILNKNEKINIKIKKNNFKEKKRSLIKKKFRYIF